METATDCRREFPRTDMRTSVQIILEDNCPDVIRGWTDDVSPAGALVLTEQALPLAGAYVRVLVPGIQDQFFRARVVRCELTDPMQFGSFTRVMHSSGIEFLGVCEEQKALQLTALVAATSD